VLLFEIGLGQAAQVKILFERIGSYDDIRFVTDAAGNARVALGRMKMPQSATPLDGKLAASSTGYSR